MNKSTGQNYAVDHLYPPIEPFKRQMVDVGSGHLIYLERCGNPNGTPVIVLHGGPGGGCSPYMRRYFDPQHYHIILFDQRGCGKSTPFADVSNNTTWDLISDIEIIRKLLKIERWILFGGSWGSTLSLLYAQSHPCRTSYMIIRGVFLMTKEELDWFYRGGAGMFFPEHWNVFISLIPKEERHDLITAYHKRLFSGNMALEHKFSSIWAGWETALAVFGSEKKFNEVKTNYTRAFSRLECHYFYNKGFLKSDNQILDNIDKIDKIPSTIIQGRYDMICPPISAYRLAQKWRNADLKMINCAGHAMSEPGISKELLSTTNKIKNINL